MEDNNNPYNSDSNFEEIESERYVNLLSRFISRKQLPKLEKFEFDSGGSVVGDIRVQSTNGYEVPPEIKNKYEKHYTCYHLGDNGDLRFCTILFRELWDDNGANIVSYQISKQVEDQLKLYEKYNRKIK